MLNAFSRSRANGRTEMGVTQAVKSLQTRFTLDSEENIRKGEAWRMNF